MAPITRQRWGKHWRFSQNYLLFFILHSPIPCVVFSFALACDSYQLRAWTAHAIPAQSWSLTAWPVFNLMPCCLLAPCEGSTGKG